jgi:outer membrane immunogenic protein
MKVKGYLLAGVAGVAMAPAAQAADMAVKAPALAPVPMSWTGWYIGVNAGAVVQHATDSYIFNGFGTTDSSATATGFIGGGQIGYNLQSGSFVYGIEGDFQGLTGKANPQGLAGGNYSNTVSWLATIRGRVGVAIGDTMPYFTAGFAASHVSNTFAPPSGDLDASYSDSSTRWGLVLGGGIEHMITRQWSVKFEGLWVDSGQKVVANGLGNARKTTKFSNSLVIARAGLNFHF